MTGKLPAVTGVIATLAIVAGLAACSTADETVGKVDLGELQDCLKRGAAGAQLSYSAGGTGDPNDTNDFAGRAAVGGAALLSDIEANAAQMIQVAVEGSGRQARRTARQAKPVTTVPDFGQEQDADPGVSYATKNVAVISFEPLTQAEKRLLNECGIGE